MTDNEAAQCGEHVLFGGRRRRCKNFLGHYGPHDYDMTLASVFVVDPNVPPGEVHLVIDDVREGLRVVGKLVGLDG